MTHPSKAGVITSYSIHYTKLYDEGEFEAVFALPDSFGIHPTLTLARELRTRFGYGVLRLH